MRTLLVPLLLLFPAVSPPASGEPITWFASNSVLSVSPDADLFIGAGLTAGTPWSLTVSFNPSAPPIRVLTPGCNQYSMGMSTLTLGSYSYTHAGGQIFTNAALPEAGCIGMLPEGEAGLIQFWFGTEGWQSDNPDAWRLSAWQGVTFAGYYDQLVKDGTLPVVPTFDPHQGQFGGMEIESGLGTLFFGGSARFQLVPEQPAPVPEPATLTLFGAGLAAALAARRKRRK